eukprot:TRINITY_DN10696_c0_g1_i2.p1 TRINITY_DN10696_c0_g1~~TRINITY_DN10696_c0_g1_i2.p1  ORF type:complete len:416 (+),score=96.06 TRINITY_DN10696_c0_g1_i2:109-1356(+)
MVSHWLYPSDTITKEGVDYDIRSQEWSTGRVAADLGDGCVCFVYWKEDMEWGAEMEVLQTVSYEFCASYEDTWNDERYIYIMAKQRSNTWLDGDLIPADSIPSVFIQMLHAVAHLHSHNWAHTSLSISSFTTTPSHLIQLSAFPRPQPLTAARQKEDIADLADVLQDLYKRKPPAVVKKLVTQMVQGNPSITDLMSSEYIRQHYLSKATITFAPPAKEKDGYTVTVTTPDAPPMHFPLPRSANVAELVLGLHRTKLQKETIDFKNLFAAEKPVERKDTRKAKKADPAQMKLNFNGTPTKPPAPEKIEKEVRKEEEKKKEAVVVKEKAKEVKKPAPEPEEKPEPPAVVRRESGTKRKWDSLSKDDAALIWNIARTFVSQGNWQELKKHRPEGFYESPVVVNRLKTALTVIIHREGQ